MYVTVEYIFYWIVNTEFPVQGLLGGFMAYIIFMPVITSIVMYNRYWMLFV